MRAQVTRSAERDIDDIWFYWAQHASLDVADRLQETIEERFVLLAEQPLIGRKCEDIGPGVRCFPVGKFLIYYRKSKSALTILHVLHGAREQKVAFRKG
jgi:toxin ParE1/3/4